MYRAMVGIGLACGLLIVTVFQLTKPIIDRNKAEALSRAIFHVLPEARSSATFRLLEDGSFERVEQGAAEDQLVYAGFDDQQRLVGFAIEAQGMGYADVVRVLYG
jgi:electron transport complex protein RnfG